MSIIIEIVLQVAGFIFRTILPYLLCFCMGWYCSNKWHHRDNPDDGGRVITMTERVLTVDSGNEITTKAGLLGRRSRVTSLWGIDIPAEVADNATTSLRSIIQEGDTIEVEVKEGRRIGRADLSGIVVHSGMNCNLEQLRRGWAKATVPDKEFVAAQAEAEKAGRGIWKKKDPDKPHRPHFPWWKEGEQ